MSSRDPSQRDTPLSRLLKRVVEQRRRPPETDRTSTGAVRVRDPARIERRLEALEEGLERLESMVEGLQDSVHREAIRYQDQTQSRGRGRAG